MAQARPAGAAAPVAPPTFAWDWLARQRLPWQEARRRLVADRGAASARYALVDARNDVVALLRTDYPSDAAVRDAVDAVVREVVFLGRTDVPLAALGVRNAPRGLRWWWEHLTGEPVAAALDAAPAPGARPGAAQLSLGLDDVLGGYGDP